LARRVFFSFHYARDAWKVGQIRNCNIVMNRYERDTFLDKAQWESIKRQGRSAIKNWIDSQIKGTSVTVVLIGTETYQREWVKYEIEKSHQDKRGLLGIQLTGMKGPDQSADLTDGPDPFNYCDLRDASGNRVSYPVYRWLAQNGRENIGGWIETAARLAGR
jgi:antiphage defense system Thoeris ThsB-like protein